MALNRDQIRASARKVFEREIPALGGTVKFREISADQRAEVVSLFEGKKSVKEQQVAAGQLIVITAVDDDMNPLFQTADEVVSDLSGAALDQMSEAALAACAMSGDAKAEAVKKSTPRRKGNSRSGSASPSA